MGNLSCRHILSINLSAQTPDCHSAQPMWNPGDLHQASFNLGFNYGNKNLRKMYNDVDMHEIVEHRSGKVAKGFSCPHMHVLNKLGSLYQND